MQVVSWILVVGFLVVLSGYFPRYTALLHVYLTFSLSTAIRLPDGGDEAAKIVTVFLAIICLADNRVNHWKISSGADSRLSPIAWAGWLGIRIQFSWIYISAAVGKVSVPEWQDGTAVYYVTRQAFFGYAGPLSDFALTLTSIPLASIAATWGTIILEMTVAVLILLPRNYRIAAVSLSMIFHIFIMVSIGLFSFGLAMISGIILALLPDFKKKRNVESDRQLIGSTT